MDRRHLEPGYGRTKVSPVCEHCFALESTEEMEVALARILREADTPHLTGRLTETKVGAAADPFSHPEALRQIAYKDRSRLKLTRVLLWKKLLATQTPVHGANS